MSEKPPATPVRDAEGAARSDRDQSPNSTVRAHDVADAAEEAAVHPIPGLPAVDSVTSGDNFRDADERGKSSDTAEPKNGVSKP
jgi:hypothetical protein